MFKLAQIERALPAVALEELKEGYAVVLKPHSFSFTFGSGEDIPGIARPSSAGDLVPGAVYVVAHPYTNPNRDLPLYHPEPSMDWSLRLGFDRPDNAPFQATVHLTPPSVTPQATVYSGTLALAIRGVVALLEDMLVSPATLNTGDFLTVVTSGADQGKFQSAGADPKVAQIVAIEDSSEYTGKKQFLVKLL